jgi:hypothetical protein
MFYLFIILRDAGLIYAKRFKSSNAYILSLILKNSFSSFEISIRVIPLFNISATNCGDMFAIFSITLMQFVCTYSLLLYAFIDSSTPLRILPMTCSSLLLSKTLTLRRDALLSDLTIVILAYFPIFMLRMLYRDFKAILFIDASSA